MELLQLEGYRRFFVVLIKVLIKDKSILISIKIIEFTPIFLLLIFCSNLFNTPLFTNHFPCPDLKSDTSNMSFIHISTFTSERQINLSFKKNGDIIWKKHFFISLNLQYLPFFSLLLNPPDANPMFQTQNNETYFYMLF